GRGPDKRSARSAMAGGGTQRSGQLDDLRDDGFPTGLWLSKGESRETHARSASKRTLDPVDRRARAGRAFCAAIARLPAPRHDRANELKWRSFATTVRLRSARLIPFWPSCCSS